MHTSKTDLVIDQQAQLNDWATDLPINATIAVAKKNINTITTKFFHSFDELLMDVASYANTASDAHNIIELRNFLHEQQAQIQHEIEALFVWSLIPTNPQRTSALKELTIQDMHLSLMVTKLRESHLQELQSIEKLYPRLIPGANIHTENNPFDPLNIYGIAYSVFNTLNMDDNSKNLCLREFHYVLKGHLRSFYRDVINTLFN